MGLIVAETCTDRFGETSDLDWFEDVLADLSGTVTFGICKSLDSTVIRVTFRKMPSLMGMGVCSSLISNQTVNP